METLKINETFYSHQGEGPSTGKPAFFIRTTGCPLRCKWKTKDGKESLCDTTYAYHEGKDYTFEELLKLIPERCNRIIITGGEPFAQKHLITFINKFTIEHGYFVEVETCAYFSIEKMLPFLYTQWNVSPKLKSSGNSKETYDAEAMDKFSVQSNTNFKFVVTDKQFEQDLSEIKAIMKKYGIEDNMVWLMPEGITNNLELSRKVIEICLQEGYNFSPRLQNIFKFR